MDRRTFTGVIAGSTAASMFGGAGRAESAAEPGSAGGYAAAARPSGLALYRSVGEELARYEVDVDGATLAKREAVALPANVQYAWPHPSRQYLYVTSSSSGPGSSGIVGTAHHVTAFRILPGGTLAAHGASLPLAGRPIHNSVDAPGSYLLIAYNNPSGVSVHRINDNGTIGEQVQQPGKLDTGIFAHQVLATPSNRGVILVTRGNDAAGGKPEDPGALKVYRFKDGVLATIASVTPGSGFGFGPRHLDFHPTQSWVYVSVERQNRLHVYRMDKDDIPVGPAFVKDTLVEPRNERPRQLAGAIHIHPSGRYVYVSNRADHTVEFEGKKVFGGGENSIAVYSIDPRSGEPTLIQHADTHGMHVRTFALDPSGRMLVAASTRSLPVRDGARSINVQSGLSVFRVGPDGKLEFLRKYDVDTAKKTQFWMGIVGLKA